MFSVKTLSAALLAAASVSAAPAYDNYNTYPSDEDCTKYDDHSYTTLSTAYYTPSYTSTPSYDDSYTSTSYYDDSYTSTYYDETPSYTTTPTYDDETPSYTVELTGVTHSVVAGLGGLRFDPDNVVAEVGDVVEWHFLPMNHSVAQADFKHPCVPSADGEGIFAGFNFFTKEGQAPDVFQIVIEDDSTPLWYYCPQTKGDHCQMGMVGVINQNFDDQTHSLAKFRDAAALTGKSIVPYWEQGGEVIPNPNPLGGF